MRILFYFTIILFVIIISGCSTTTGSNSGSIGADSGPWPSKPTRDLQSSTKDNDKVVLVPLWINIRCQLGEKESLVLDVESVELKSDKQKTVLFSNKDLELVNPTGIKFNSKQQYQIISSSPIKKYKYIQFKFKINDEGSFYMDDKIKYNLVAYDGTITLANWIPIEPVNDIRSNLLILSLKRDDLILNKEKMTAEIRKDSISITPASPTGAISGKVSVFQPSTKLIAIFNGTTLELRSVIPESSDGSFSITGLPPGLFKLKIITGTNAFVLNDKVIDVKDKTVDIKEVKIEQQST